MKNNLRNQAARDQLASLVRALYTNRITNLEFDERAEEIWGEDHAATQIFWLGVWPTYDDFRVQRFLGEHVLSRDDKRTIARWILFLKSGQPYKWPNYPHLPAWLGYLVIAPPILSGSWLYGSVGAALGALLGLFLVVLAEISYSKRKGAAIEKLGDSKVWPFISIADYEVALKNPPYLCGTDRRA